MPWNDYCSFLRQGAEAYFLLLYKQPETTNLQKWPHLQRRINLPARQPWSPKFWSIIEYFLGKILIKNCQRKCKINKCKPFEIIFKKVSSYATICIGIWENDGDFDKLNTLEHDDTFGIVSHNNKLCGRNRKDGL